MPTQIELDDDAAFEEMTRVECMELGCDLHAPSELIKAAQRAGIPTPPHPTRYAADEFPQFFVFHHVQLHSSLTNPDQHFKNAMIIAMVPASTVLMASFGYLESCGVEV